MRRIIFAIVSLLLSTGVFGQNGEVYGTIYGEGNKPLPDAHVQLQGKSGGVNSDDDGKYELSLPAGRTVVVEYSHLGYSAFEIEFDLRPNQKEKFDLLLKKEAITIQEFEVEDENLRSGPMEAIDPINLENMVSASGDFNTILFSNASVSSSNELSSSYSVRGGNFDENLVYVNGIQVYRPFLTRSGQQEGLSFVNPNMVSSVLFAAGGFEAKYGDKMSSVLDIKYKEPRRFGASASGGLLGGAAHVEGTSKSYRFTHISGIRYKSNQYLLGSLDTQGDYKPAFSDLQTYLTYDIRDNFQLGFLGNVSRNRYTFIPQDRETEFGNVNEALKLTVYYEGQEEDRFDTYFGALNGRYYPSDNSSLQFTASAFRTQESETFDLLGEYWLHELDRDLGSDQFGEIAGTKGVGTFLNHARNELDALVLSFAHRGYIEKEQHLIEWGGRFNQEVIFHTLSEWNMIDSSGYSIPQGPSDKIELQDVVKSNLSLNTYRYTAFLQDRYTWEFSSGARATASAGVRGHFWTNNEQLVISPRGNLSFHPVSRPFKKDSTKLRDVVYRLSAGIYAQPPFYKEIRTFDGRLADSVLAQKSFHVLFGTDRVFRMWRRTFKLVSEIYYKHLWDLNTYEIDNVRIRYYANNSATGYATGIEFKLNGEFVPGIESWASLSVSKTMEDVKGDSYTESYNKDGELIIPGYTFDQVVDSVATFTPGFIPRPMDQRINFAIFFQDEMPKWPSFKVHLHILFGSRLPFGPPSFERFRDTLRMPPYRRVDIGFTKSLINDEARNSERRFFKHFKDLTLSMEVFNLLQINNTISYLWLQDIFGRYYAIPNFLTSRRVNVKLSARF